MATRWTDHILGPDTTVNRPAPAAAPVGAFYQNSDTGDLEINTGTAWGVYRAAVAAGVTSVVAGTGISVDDTDPANPVVAASGGGGSSVPTRRWNVGPGETSVAEWDGSDFSGFTRVDAASAGRVSWTEAAGGLSAKHNGSGSDGTDVYHAAMIALSGFGGALAVGDGFVYNISVLGAANSVLAGLMLADGVTVGSGKQLASLHYGTPPTYTHQPRALTGYNTLASGGAGGTGGNGLLAAPIWVRISKQASNVWRVDTSPNDVDWITNTGATVTYAFTPTYVGVTTTDWNTSTQSIVDFGPIRRVTGVT